ncbi:NAD(P)-dependent dehydrogenase (short-subunit alcohol dehydrogenase family) [Nocardioides sp. BE266]|uniref:SDR family NAD(P)-dependent oxidoreductase n=1 Tax=Nocardioides sp. BE266 TaxID=2817725 RepID=UPI002856740F|nr:SDR family oxidoreductase [Nocardioides sp. BE266]MDR7254289.1 NAD(P)-dependent dehydrogenase (short-subunit alcohol dehydrogenase family) [Nocardioides sp. BE266]
MTGTGAVVVRDYSDAVVVIAGGTSGIGLASAHAFAAAGVRRLVLLGRRTERGVVARDEVAAACPEAEVLFLSADAADPDEVSATFRDVEKHFGAVDVVVCSVAPDVRPELLLRQSAGEIVATVAAFADPALVLTHAAMTIMRRQGGGSIINVASDAGKTATPGEAAIGAGMAAICMFSRVAAVEGKRDGIRVNTVTPSLVMGTETTAKVLETGFSKKLFEKAAEQAHLGVCEPKDVAALVVYLAGPAAAKLTGQTISVNGGISAV